MRPYRGFTAEGKEVRGYYCCVAGKHYIIPEDIAEEYSALPLPTDFIEVLPESVGQSTGLKDKKGVEIYGGDIVKIIRCDDNKEEIAFVEWSAHDCSFTYSRISGQPCQYVYKTNTNIQPEVIGNVTQKPELLK